MTDEIKTNIETIKKQLENDTFIKEYIIVDGISLECKIPEKKTFKQCQTELNKKCKALGLLPISTELNQDDKKLFLLQFPELTPYYTEEHQYNIFYKSAEYFIKTSIELSKRAGTIVTRKMLLDTIEKIVYEITKLCYNSNVNKYKVTLEDLKNDAQLNNQIKLIVEEVINVYTTI